MSRIAAISFACALSPLSGAALAYQIDVPPAAIPALPESAADAIGFTPAGWRVESHAEGDLDRDGRPDIAFVIREHDPAKIVSHDALGEDPLDSNPRILVVAFAGEDGRYRLVEANHELIPRRTVPTLIDPFDGIAIDRGSVLVQLTRFQSAGSWSAGNHAYRFRWQDGAMALIGYDSFDVRRNTGETMNVSVNFLTRRMSVGSGRIDLENEDTRWRNLPRRALLTIDEVGDGLAFDPGVVS